MKKPTMRTALVLSAVALAGALTSGCDKKEKQRDSEGESSDAGMNRVRDAHTWRSPRALWL